MRSLRPLLLSAALLSSAFLTPAAAAHAQAASATDTRRAFASREELAAEAARLQAAGASLEAAAIRARLTEGDFKEGDRILFSMQGATPIAGDTLIVRAGRIIQLPQMEDFRLAGVLRSELQPRLSSHLARFLRDPQIRVVPLIRLAILGAIRAPGFYYVPADIPISDILMRAGGPGPESDLRKVEVRRDNRVVVSRGAARTALADGLSADRLNLATGDQVVVGQKRRIGWQAITSTVLASSGLLIGIWRATSGEKRAAEPTCP